MDIHIERSELNIVKLEVRELNEKPLLLLDYGRQQRPIYSDDFIKIGVTFRMNSTLGGWIYYNAEIDYFITPITALTFKQFLDIIIQAEKIYKEDFNNMLVQFSSAFALDIPVVDELDARLQFEEFLRQ